MNVKQGQFTINNTTGNQSITDVGFQPKIVFFFPAGTMSADGVAAHAHTSIGAGISSSERYAMFSRAENGVNGMSFAGRRGYTAASCILVIDNTATSLEYAADFVSQDAGGFTINVTTATASSSYKVNYLALGGSELTNVKYGYITSPASTGSQSYTSVGFQPDAMFFFSLGSGTVPPTVGYASGGVWYQGFGMAAGGGQGTQCEATNSGIPYFGSNSYQRNDKCISMIYSSSSLLIEASHTSFNADGFTLNWTTTTSNICVPYIALKGTNFKVGSFDTQTSTGNFSVSSLGFNPQGLILASILQPSSTSIYSGMKKMLSVASSTSARAVSGGTAENGVTPTDCDQFLDSASVYIDYDYNQTVIGEADLYSFNADGFTLNQTDADPSAIQVLYMAMGNALNSNDVKANIKVTTTQINSVKAALELNLTDNNSVKANIKVTNTNVNSAKSNLTYRNLVKDNYVLARIKATVTQNNSVKADILYTNTKINSVKAALELNQTVNTSSKANVKVTNTDINSVKASIKTTNTDINSVKARIKNTYTDNNSSKSNITYRNVTDIDSVKANIKTTYTDVNSVKAWMFTAWTNDQSAKAWIYAIVTQIDSSKASIKRTFTNAQSVKANITYRNVINIDSAKANITWRRIFDNYAVARLQNTMTATFSVRANIKPAFLEKHFEYRIYDKDNSQYITTWSSEILSDPKFRMIINGSPGEMVVKMGRKFDDFGEDVDVKLFNVVRIYCSDRDTLTGVLLYTGFISGYRPVLDGHQEYIEITLLHQSAQLSQLIYRDENGDTSIDQFSVEPSDIYRNILDRAQADGGVVSYNANTIDNTGTTTSYTFNAYTTKEALDKAIELTPQNWFWRIDADNKLYLKESNLATPDHTFLIGKHISQMETWRRGEDIINRIYFVGGDVGLTKLYRVYSNTGSIAAYGVHAIKKTDSRVTIDATADSMANRIIDKKKDPEIRTTLYIRDNNGQNPFRGYDIESVKVGQTMKIKNIKQGVKTITLWDTARWDEDVWDQTLAYLAADVIQIMSIDYEPNGIKIEASSRLPEIPKRIEDIQRNLDQETLADTPATPVEA